jgi:hypothetical protein
MNGHYVDLESFASECTDWEEREGLISLEKIVLQASWHARLRDHARISWCVRQGRMKDYFWKDARFSSGRSAVFWSALHLRNLCEVMRSLGRRANVKSPHRLRYLHSVHTNSNSSNVLYSKRVFSCHRAIVKRKRRHVYM